MSLSVQVKPGTVEEVRELAFDGGATPLKPASRSATRASCCAIVLVEGVLRAGSREVDVQKGP